MSVKRIRDKRVLTVVGNRPQFIKAAAVSHRLRAADEECWSTPASTTTRSSRRSSSPSSACRGPSTASSWAAAPTQPRPRACWPRWSRCSRASARSGARLRRHELDAGGRAGRRAGADPGRARRGGHALVRPRDARRSSTACSPITPRRCCCAPRRRRRSTCAPSGWRARSRWSATSWSTSRCCSARARRPHRRARGLRRHARRVPARHRPPGRQRRRPGGWRGSSSCSRRSRPGRVRSTRARARGWRRRGRLDAPASCSRPARLPRVHRAAAERARRADRLRRRAEGGLPGGRAVRDAARHDRVDGDGRRGLERARRPRRGRRARRARAPPARGAAASSTATGGRANGSRALWPP